MVSLHLVRLCTFPALGRESNFENLISLAVAVWSAGALGELRRRGELR